MFRLFLSLSVTTIVMILLLLNDSILPKYKKSNRNKNVIIIKTLLILSFLYFAWISALSGFNLNIFGYMIVIIISLILSIFSMSLMDFDQYGDKSVGIINENNIDSNTYNLIGRTGIISSVNGDGNFIGILDDNSDIVLLRSNENMKSGDKFIITTINNNDILAKSA